jgi:hypothetical protein
VHLAGSLQRGQASATLFTHDRSAGRMVNGKHDVPTVVTDDNIGWPRKLDCDRIGRALYPSRPHQAIGLCRAVDMGKGCGRGASGWMAKG